MQAENPRGFTSSRWKEIVQLNFFLSKWETIWTMLDALLSRLLHLIETPQLQELLVVKPNLASIWYVTGRTTSCRVKHTNSVFGQYAFQIPIPATWATEKKYLQGT